MPAPATADELLDLIQRSGVADEARLRAYVQKLTASSGIPADPQKFAGVLVRDGVLTYFQAEQLLQGKYKRFTIGKYKVLEKLGAGGMAQVFLCEHKLMRRRVAIKVLPTAKADDPSSLERFYREARAVAAVDHPNIVRAYDIDQDENLHFLVMEYVDGTNLQDLVKKFGPLDVLRSCHYVYGAAVGLQHAHEMGLIHRDIKPSNILLDRTGVVKILDMGLARFFHDEDDALTKKYDENVLGTADYLAPEQALDSHTVDIRADLYSLGATFYYLLTGSAPFPEGSVAQKLIWHQNRQPRSVKAIRPDVPDEVVAVVARMMAKKVEERYQTPAEVIAALAGWVATPIPPPTEREMPQVSPAAGGVSSRGPATMVAAAPPAPGVFTRTATTPALPPQPSHAPVPVAAAPAPSAPARPVAQAAAPQATPLPDHDPVNPAVWESLDTDTQAVSRADTERPPSKSGAPVRRPTPPKDKDAPRPNAVLYAAAGGVLLVAVAAGAYFAFFRKGGGTDVPTPPPTGPQKITVGDGENTVPTLREALSKAQPGDTIVVAKPRLVEANAKLTAKQHRDLTIEGVPADGRLPVVELGATTGVMFDAISVEGVRIRNLEFDVKGRADVGVQVSGNCPGCAIENVTVRNARVAAFRFSNAAGGDGRPIVLDRGRALTTPGTFGVLITSANADTHHLVVRNSRFEGAAEKPGGTGVRVEGATTDVEVAGNRFFALDAAVAFARVTNPQVVKGAVTGNTVFQVKAGLVFDLTPASDKLPPLGKFALAVSQNYFARTLEVAKGNGGGGVIPGVDASANAQGPDCGGGNIDLKLTRLDVPPPKADPNDDATFLRFPGGPPEVGGKKVGAP